MRGWFECSILASPFTSVILQELTPNLPSSIMDPFASHVVRALLGLLCPHLFPADQQNKSSHVRSKKSAAYKAKQGAMKSVFTPDNPLSGPSRQTPPEFNETARSFVTLLKEKLDENEVRALAANQVASPVLQVRGSFLLWDTPFNSENHVDASGGRSKPTNAQYPWFTHGPGLGWVNHSSS